MPFFLNPFTADFLAPWLLSDRQYNPDFKCPRNAGRGDELVVSYGAAPYNLSGNDADGDSKAVLTISFALNERKNWADLAVTLSGASMSAVTPQEVLTSLQANAVFADFFTANLNQDRTAVQIRQKKPVTNMIFYIKKGRAETVLNFNKFAGVSEMPEFFARHTIANRFVTDSQNALIALDPANLDVDANIIDNAVDEKGNSKNFDSSTVRADWQLLRGRSGIFNFQKITVDGSNRITEIIEYPAGAIEGDLARKILYVYTGANTHPDQITEIPYILITGDFVTP